MDEEMKRLLQFRDYVATVVGKTYVVRGDAFEMSDDEALARIRDRLDAEDPTLVEQNKDKKLARRA